MSPVVKSMFEDSRDIREYRRKMYARYTTDSIPIMHETNPQYLQEEINENAKPDRRLYNHFEGEIVDTKVDYLLGVPVVVGSTEDDTLAEEVRSFNIAFNYEDLFKEVGTTAVSTGTGGVLLYADGKDGDVAVKELRSEEFYVRYNLSSPEYAIRTYRENEVIVAELFDDELIYKFYLDEDDGMWKQSYDEPIVHGFTRVPIVEVANNKMMHSDFHSVTPLIDAYNRLVTDLSNEVETFRLAYLVLKNIGATEEDLARLRRTGAISVDDDGDISFLTKSLNTEAFKVMRETLERNITRFSGHVIFSNSDFTGNLTRIAVQFKTKPLERKARTLELKFIKFLREFYRTAFTYKAWPNTFDYTKLRLTFTRNLPMDIVEESKLLKGLSGLVSYETAASLMSFIDSPEEEVKRIKAEEESGDKPSGFGSSSNGGVSFGSNQT